MVNTIGVKFLQANIENEEFSYPKVKKLLSKASDTP